MMSAQTPLTHPGINLPAHGNDEEKLTRETAVFGFWVFLMSDLVLFGVVFAVYITMIGATAGGPGPKEIFNFTSLAAQTLALLLSSLTVGFASLALKYKLPVKRLLLWLFITLLLGIVFLVLEIQDFNAMLEMGGVPSRSGYLSAFFALVPLHGLHVAFGCLWLGVLLVQIYRSGLVEQINSRLLRFALFWHFLDLIWVGIFSIAFFAGWLYV